VDALNRSRRRDVRVGTLWSSVVITAVATVGVMKGIDALQIPSEASAAATVAPPKPANDQRSMNAPTTRPTATVATTAPATRPSAPVAAVKLTDRKAQLRALRTLRNHVSILHDLRAQVALFKLQHRDRLPDLKLYPGWRQLVERTDADGVPTPVGKYGPYLGAMPVNPINDRAVVLLVSKPPQLGARVSVPNAGYVFEKTTGRVWMTDAAGCVLDDLAILAACRAADAEDPARREPFRVLPPAQGRVVMKSAILTLRSQIALYKLMHDDIAPDFTRAKPWEQLTSRTRRDGTPDPNGRYGPYYDEPPRNALNGSSEFAVIDRLTPTSHDAAARRAGYVYETATGHVWATDENWKVLRD
jgi:hypothetical protein